MRRRPIPRLLSLRSRRLGAGARSRGGADCRWSLLRHVAPSAQSEGRLLRLPSGDVRLVIGAEYHDEELDTRVGGTGRPTLILFPQASRTTRAFYAEASVLLVSPDAAPARAHRLLPHRL